MVSDVAPRQHQLLLEMVTSQNMKISHGLMVVWTGTGACILTFCQLYARVSSVRLNLFSAADFKCVIWLLKLW